METTKNEASGIRLLKLTLDNFKCLKHFDLDLEGMDGEVYATNGMGKTSLADAYFWLLTGKDSAGGMPADKLFPVDAPSGVEVSVAADFAGTGGQTFSLGRVLKRKIQRARGEAEATMRGTSTEYSINGVVKPQREYNAFVQEAFGDENTLRMLSDHRHFAETMHWEERRDLLIKSFAPHVTDLDVIEAHQKELNALRDYVGAMHTVRELEDQQRRERHKLKKKLEEIPNRIDEAERSRPDLTECGCDLPLAALAKKRAALLVELNDLQNGGAIAQAETEAAACQERLSKAKADYLTQNRGGNEDLERQCAELRKSIQDTQITIAKCQGVAHSAKKSMEVAGQELTQLRQEAKDIHYRTFPADAAVCPTCGQPLPPDKLEEHRARFNEKRAKDMENNRARGLACAQSFHDLEDIIKENTEKVAQQEKERASLQKKLAGVQARIIEPAPFEDTPVCEKLTAQLEAARKACLDLREQSQPRIEAKKQELALLDADFDKARKQELLATQVKKADARIKELQDEEKTLGLALARAENLLALAERFVELQAQDIEEKVNNAFSLVRWQLFEKQVNGGVSPCCKATVHGISWEAGINALNTASRVNAGLDIINTLSEALGRSLPVWIDNAESVAYRFATTGQCIRLYVSLQDQDLRIESDKNKETEKESA